MTSNLLYVSTYWHFDLKQIQTYTYALPNLNRRCFYLLMIMMMIIIILMTTMCVCIYVDTANTSLTDMISVRSHWWQLSRNICFGVCVYVYLRCQLVMLVLITGYGDLFLLLLWKNLAGWLTEHKQITQHLCIFHARAQYNICFGPRSLF